MLFFNKMTENSSKRKHGSVGKDTACGSQPSNAVGGLKETPAKINLRLYFNISTQNCPAKSSRCISNVSPHESDGGSAVWGWGGRDSEG